MHAPERRPVVVVTGALAPYTQVLYRALAAALDHARTLGPLPARILFLDADVHLAEPLHEVLAVGRLSHLDEVGQGLQIGRQGLMEFDLISKEISTVAIQLQKLAVAARRYP